MSRHLKLQDEDVIILDESLCLQARQKAVIFGRYSIVYHRVEKVINDKAPEAFRTASVLRWRVKHRNELLFLQADLANELNLSVPTVSRHLKMLRDIGLIVPNPLAPNSAWLIHPLFAWYGGAKEKEKYWKELPAGHAFRQIEVEPEYFANEPDDEDE